MNSKEDRSVWETTSQFITDYEAVLLLLLLPTVIFPGPFTVVLLLIIPLLWIVRKVTTGRFAISTPADWAILLLLIMLLVSLYATFDLTFSAPRVAGIVYGIAVFYAAAAFASRSEKRLFWGVAALLLCGLIVAGLSLLGTHWTDKLPFLAAITDRLPQLVHLEAAPAGFSPNQVAGTLLWVLPVYITLTVAGLWETRLMRRGRAKIRWAVVFVGVGSVVILGTLLLTQSRGGYAGLAAALLFMAFTARSWRPAVLVGGALALLLLLVGLWVLSVADWPAGGMPFAQSDADGESGYGEIFDFVPSGAESLEGRLEIWSRALYGLEDFPFTGMGVGTFRRVVPVLYPLFLISPDSDIAHAHNHLLQVGLDLGLPGLIAYVALWLLAGVMLWRSWRLRENRWQGVLVIGFAGALVGYFVYGMNDTVALGAKPGFIFWLELGLITGMHQLLSQGRRPAD